MSTNVQIDHNNSNPDYSQLAFSQVLQSIAPAIIKAFDLDNQIEVGNSSSVFLENPLELPLNVALEHVLGESNLTLEHHSEKISLDSQMGKLLSFIWESSEELTPYQNDPHISWEAPTTLASPPLTDDLDMFGVSLTDALRQKRFVHLHKATPHSEDERSELSVRDAIIRSLLEDRTPDQNGVNLNEAALALPIKEALRRAFRDPKTHTSTNPTIQTELQTSLGLLFSEDNFGIGEVKSALKQRPPNLEVVPDYSIGRNELLSDIVADFSDFDQSEQTAPKATDEIANEHIFATEPTKPDATIVTAQTRNQLLNLDQSEQLKEPPLTQSTIDLEDKTKIKQRLSDGFNLSELKELCFDIGVSYEDLTYQNRSDLILELIGYVERRGQVGTLLEKTIERRPNLKLGTLLAKYPAASRTKAQIILPYSEHVDTEHIRHILAQMLQIESDQISILTVAHGSIHILIDLPPEAAKRLEEIAKQYPEALAKLNLNIDMFDNISADDQNRWREIYAESRPEQKGSFLIPTTHWLN